MSNEVAIRIENLGKRYKYGAVASKNDTLRADLADWVRGLFRRNSDQRSAVSGQQTKLTSDLSSLTSGSQPTSDLRPPISGSQPTSDLRPPTSGSQPTSDLRPLTSSPSSLIPQHSSFKAIHEEHLAHDPNYFWALKDINLEVRQGEVVGIIGRNGAGKSTLLKILSRITPPTTGSITYNGRIASLLEVGTGFHRELTGRENILLNGSILGMKRAEIAKKFDEIVAFAEVEKFIDTPVKFYSSGMYVRLAFAVAAHLEPEILILDEVLAVGDATFQKKCLGKMGDVARQGRTVIFVSHNMGAVSRLCARGIWLEQGRMRSVGLVDRVISEYTQNALSGNAELAFPPELSKRMQFSAIRLLDHQGNPATELDRNHPFQVQMDYVVRESTSGAHVGVMLDQADGVAVWHTVDIDTIPQGELNRQPGVYRAHVKFPGGLLNAGGYSIRTCISRYGSSQAYDYCEAFVFQLNDHGTFAALGAGGRQRPGVIAMPVVWTTEMRT